MTHNHDDDEHDVYTKDVWKAFDRYQLGDDMDQLAIETARVAARRVAWAVAAWWRNENLRWSELAARWSQPARS